MGGRNEPAFIPTAPFAHCQNVDVPDRKWLKETPDREPPSVAAGGIPSGIHALRANAWVQGGRASRRAAISGLRHVRPRPLTAARQEPRPPSGVKRDYSGL